MGEEEVSKHERETPPTGNIKRSSRRIHLANTPNRTLITAEYLLLLSASRVYFEVHFVVCGRECERDREAAARVLISLAFRFFFYFLTGNK